MNIELSKVEIELLDTALLSWEKEASSSAITTMLMSAILCPKEERANYRERSMKEIDEAEVESKSRRLKATMLRARLFQALARESEHDLST